LGGAAEDTRFHSRERVRVRYEDIDQHSAIGRFVAAVLALSDDPAPPNLDRYLIASRRLEDARSAASSQRRDERLTQLVLSRPVTQRQLDKE
jgi:hypothetical protein